MSVSKKIRFEVFKRDGFKCAYCGKTPPEVMLEIDHIQPKSKNGSDEIDNLITSCFDCNRGKSHIELTAIPNTMQLNKEIIEERENQYLEYQKVLRKVEKRLRKEILEVGQVYNNFFPKYIPSEIFNTNSMKPFIQKLGLSVVKESMELACSKQLDDNKTLKYFCGICWNKIKGVKPDWER
jgi:hypothetical protein